MIQFHPDIHLLTDYCAGSLPMSQALCVAAHLEYCSKCRSEVENLNSLGSELVYGKADVNTDTNEGHTHNELSPNDIKLSKSLINNVFGALDSIENEPLGKPSTVSSNSVDKNQTLPRCMHKLAPNGIVGLEWKKLSASLSVSRLATGDTQCEVALHKLQPGRGVANHDHCGREITVVLCGSFSDQQGLYLPGDFLVKDAGDQHRPIASEDMECICLSVLEAPVKFTGTLTRLINPFLKIYPAAD